MENEKFKIENGVLIEYTGNDEIIEIPNTVSVIGEAVFKNKFANKVIIPNSVKIIEKHAFRESGFAEIIMNDGVMIIKEAAFWWGRCRSITFSKNLKEIHDNAFYCFQCYEVEIQKMELPEGVIKIGNGAFENADWLVTIPSSVKEIGRQAYSGIDMEELVIPSKINTISEEAFSYCRNLEKVVIENATIDWVSYHRRDDFATEKEEELEEVEVLEGVTEIKRSAFSRCEKLREITFPNTLKEIGRNAFCGCSSLKRVNIIVNQFLDIDYKAFEESGLEELYICVTKSLTIKENAFEGLESLRKVKIIGTQTSNVTIEYCAFENCQRLEKVDIVTDGKVEIGNYAFKNCRELEEINIVGTGIDIGECSFEECALLRKINLKPGYLDVHIKWRAFYNCCLLETVNVLANCLMRIEEYSFEGCESLERINGEVMISFDKSIQLYSCTKEEIVKVIKNSDEIEVSLKSRSQENDYEIQNSYDKSEELSEATERIEEILTKLEEIDESLKILSKNKGSSNVSLSRETIDDLVDGIWDIL